MSAFNEAFTKIFGSPQSALKDRANTISKFKEAQRNERKANHRKPMATRIIKTTEV